MKCKMNSIPFDKQLSLTQVSQQVKHPNPEQALLSALADYMFQNEINGTLEVETFNTSCHSSSLSKVFVL